MTINMKGLLVKDIRLISKFKVMAVILLFVVMILLLQGDGGNYAFIIAYSTMMVGVISLSTISTDENDRNLPFIMTLPITKKIYVTEKYALVVLSSVIGSAVSIVCCMLTNIPKSNEIFQQGIAIFMVLSIYHMIMLPLQLKYSDKSRIAVFSLVAFGMFIYLVSGKIVNSLGMLGARAGFTKEDVINVVDKILSLNKFLLGAGCLIIWLLCWALSFMVSMGIMNKKEF